MPPEQPSPRKGRCRLHLFPDANAAPCRRATCAIVRPTRAWAWCHNAMREQSCAPHALTRCAPALPFAQELKLWGGDVTLELGNLASRRCASAVPWTWCSLRDAAWRRARTTTVTQDKGVVLVSRSAVVQNAPCFELGSCPHASGGKNGGESEVPCTLYGCHTRL